MIEIRKMSISKKSDGRVLLENFDFNLHKGDKIAIIGEEGNGKSSLLKAIYNKKLVEEYCDVEGTIKISGRVGYLEQFIDEKWNDCIVSDYFLKNTPEDEIDYDKYNELATVSQNFLKVNLNQSLLESDQTIGTLSGGEKVKLQLIKILTNEPDILLLDEPTNDLDLETLKWLEKFINESNIPIIFISHDETLLENTANGIIHIEQIRRKTKSKVTIERLDYASYIGKRFGLLQKQEQVARKQRSDYQKQQEQFKQVYQKVEHQQNTITRADPHGAKLLKKKMKSLKSQEKRYEREKESFEEIPDVEEAINIHFSETISVPNGKKILDCKLDKLNIGDKILANNIKFTVTGPTHNVIIGKNGVGKTTLFSEIYKLLKDRNDISLGYMPQNYDNYLPLEELVVDYLALSKSNEDITKARTYLGSMKFTHEEATGKINSLSGGQKAKLFILKLILNNNDVLLLDEPTRNLSPLSNPVIRNILANYTGTIISISHDRKYIEEVCDYVYELTQEGLKLIVLESDSLALTKIK